MNKRERILEKVLALLSQSDTEDSLTISNVARAMDIGKSTLYEYFTSKDAMIEEAMRLLLKKNRAMLLDKSELETLPFEEAFKRHMRRSINLAQSNEIVRNFAHHPEVMKLPEHVKKNMMKAIQEHNTELEKALMDMFAKGENENVLKGPLQKERFRTIEAMIFGLHVAFSWQVNGWDREAQVEDLYQSLILIYNQ
ncbi:MAG: TetR/AcrR family transcriptional regulator [Bacillota bacterium]